MKGIAVIVTAVLVVVSAHAMPALTYHVRACTPGVDCYVSAHGTAPGSPGPANADFRRFYGALLGVDLSGDAFTWTTATNADGYWFGSVDDTADDIHTSYLWLTDHFLCCAIDAPYAIVDGNDRNFFLGIDGNGVSNANQPLSPAFLAQAGGPFALPPVPYGLLPASWNLIGSDAASVRFVAIDDGDRILATWDRGWLEFDPVAFDPVPEPVTAWLILPLVLMLFARRRVRS